MKRFKVNFQTFVRGDSYSDRTLWIDADDHLEAINTVLSMILPVDGIEIHSVERVRDE